jgi:hypothetical protein
VEITDEFQEIRLLLHHDGLVPILKEMTGTVVTPVEGPSVPGEQAPHAAGERAIPRADQQVRMIRKEGPGVDGERPLLGQAGQASHEVASIRGISEDGPAFESAHHHMVECVGASKRGWREIVERH